MLLAAALLLSTLEPQWERIAEYQSNNSYVGLEITKATAEYVPFFHDDKKPDQCMPSRVTFTFTIQNKGKTPARLPKFLYYEANKAKPWMRRTDPIDLTKEANPVIGGILQLRPEERKTLKPTEQTTLTAWTVPPHGPWNPMKLEARFAEQAAADIVWVGVERPFATSAAVSAPDYQPDRTVSKQADGKPREEAVLWEIAAFFKCEGPAVGGPVEMKVKVYRQNSDSASLSTGESFDRDDGLSFLSKVLTARGRPDWDRLEASIRVGCPKHKFTYAVIDGNPSNDTRIMKRGGGEGDGGSGDGR